MEIHTQDTGFDLCAVLLQQLAALITFQLNNNHKIIIIKQFVGCPNYETANLPCSSHWTDRVQYKWSKLL